MSIGTVFAALYILAVIGLSLYGFNALLLSFLYLTQRGRGQRRAAQLQDWPRVTVQLPIFNERFVVERLIDAAAALDYPTDRLSIQVLDDSTDATVELAQARVAQHRARGINIEHVRRAEREGAKAGALAAATASAPGDFIAIFDADFVPPVDFLRRVMPEFADEAIGMVQVRWGHLNDGYSPLTRVQAMALDGHFVVEQTARSRSGLFFTFNGSAGVWRRTCIDEAGGWHSDTLAEDLDLSYRAQLRGWRFQYRSEFAAPAEVPAQMQAFKRQQFRWVKGSIQCLRKVGGDVLRSENSVWRKVQAVFHLGGYLVHPMMVLLLLSSLPLLLAGSAPSASLGALGLAGLGPPVLYAVSQISIYPDGWKRYLAFPLLMLLGAGIAFNNTLAVIEALLGRNATDFLRTPKGDSVGQNRSASSVLDYALLSDWTTFGELLLAVYALAAAGVALSANSGLAPFLLLFAGGFSFVALTSVFQSWRVLRGQRALRAVGGTK